MTHGIWLVLALMAAPAAACIHPLGEEASAVGEVTRDCVVPPPAGVRALGAPASLEYGDHSLWLWDEVALTDGGAVAGAGAIAADPDTVCARGPALVMAGARPASLLALTAAEDAANAARTDGKRLALLPRGGFVHGGDGYLFYVHALVGPGVWDVEELGSGLCVLPAGAAACERLAVGGDTILWPGTRRALDRGGLVVDGRALVIGCRRAAAFVEPCVVSGAPLDRLRDPAAYQVWNAFSGWIDDVSNGTSIADGVGALTVSADGDRFAATTLDIFANRVSVRFSDSATDGYRHAIDLFDVVPASFFVAGGREHAGLRGGEPRTLHVSYATDGAAAPGLHLVSYRFFGDVE